MGSTSPPEEHPARAGGVPGERRVAVVTGAARGIGAATVAALADRGLRVLAVDACAGSADPQVPYPLAGVDELAAVVAPYGDRVRSARVDVRDGPGLERAVEEAVAAWGRVDVAVAAAAVMVGGTPIWEVDDEQVQLLWDVDVRGVLHLVRATVPRFLSGPDPSGCRFVAVASQAAGTGMFGLGAYGTAKHAVVGLVRGLAADLVGTGVSAVAVSPGPTRTRMLEATAAAYGVEVAELLSGQLLRDVLEPAELGEVIALCCSRAGRALNGSVVAADGGAV